MGWFFGPLGPPPSSAAKPGDFCEDCLSAQREFRSSPAWRATQETRSVAEGGGQGRLSLAVQRKEPSAGCPGPKYPREAHNRMSSRLPMANTNTTSTWSLWICCNVWLERCYLWTLLRFKNRRALSSVLPLQNPRPNVM